MIFNNNVFFIFRHAKGIKVTGKNVPNPIQSFSDYEFPEYIMVNIMKQNFTEPTPVQAQGWPLVLSGRDLVGIAQVRFFLILNKN